MMPRPTQDPVLQRYKAALEALYGDKIERVVLFGSRARGDAHAGSDYDIAVFLKAMPDRWQELDRLANLGIGFLDDDGALFDTKPYAATAWQERTPLMREIRRDGVAL
jgi:predicted nucleotidyltransferase